MSKVTLTIDLDGPAEVPEQLRERLNLLVGAGLNHPGERLPTVRQLALDLELNANAVKRICETLCEEGTLKYREGAGVYCIGMPAVTARHKEVFDV